MAEKSANADFTRGGTTTSIENLMDLENIARKGKNVRLKMMLGIYPKRENGKVVEGKSQYSQEKYKFFLDAPFEISNKCCNVMKKNPAHTYGKETGRKPIIATMASESRLRTQKWVQNGCNGFDMKSPVSTPMSFWNDQDILAYVKEFNIPLCSVYGEVKIDYEAMGQCEGQTDIFDFLNYDEFAKNRPLLTTSGCKRTGCVACGFGCHLDKSPTRFERLKETHPKLYDFSMNTVKNNGYSMKEAIDWVNEHGNMNIRY